MLSCRFAKVTRIFSSINYYSLLGVSEDSSFAQIRTKYIQKLKTSHPDSDEGNHRKFLELKKAYETLNDPSKRKVYDLSIGIENAKWQYTDNHVNPNFDNQQIQRILGGNVKSKVKIKSIQQNLCMRLKQQHHQKLHKKNVYTSLLFPMASFSLFWVLWQTGERFMLMYAGNDEYEHRTSNVGRDLSIAVTQIR